METLAVVPDRLTLKQVMDDACHYHPFQLVELLQQLSGGNSRIRIRPSDSLAFPAADVYRVQWQADKQLDIRVRFDGFYGVDAPLPHYFLEDATVDTEYAGRIQSFLDIFNQPFYQLCHSVWNASRFYDTGAACPGILSRTLGVLLAPRSAGMGLASRYPGVYLQKQANLRSLASLLRQLLGCSELEVDTDSYSWQALSGSTLGQYPSVNGNLVLGRRVPVRGQLLIIRLGQLDNALAMAVQPGGKLSSTLMQVLHSILPEQIDWSVTFTMQSTHEAHRLGANQTRLGRHAVLTGQSPIRIKQHYTRSQYRHLLQQATNQ